MKRFFLPLLGLALSASATATATATVAPTATLTPTPTATPSGNVIVSGSTGANGGYVTLKAAFDALNANGTQAGNTILVSIARDTNEGTLTAALNQPSVSSWTSLTIRPVGARTVTGATTAGNSLINFNGADNVRMDGLNTGGNSLSVTNTTVSGVAGTSTIRFIADATNNTVTRCSIRGSSTTPLGTVGGTIIFSTGTTTGNDGNTVSECNIGAVGTNLPSKAIFALGSTSSLGIRNSEVVIDNNNIFNFFLSNGSTSGVHILSGNDNWTISNNRIHQGAGRTFTTTVGSRYAGIALNTTTLPGAFTVTGNSVGFATATGTGTTRINGTGNGLQNEFRGIDALSVNTTIATSIQGNTISGIEQTTNRNQMVNPSAAFAAIALGSGLFNVGTVTGNTIGSLDGSSTIVINDASTSIGTTPILGILDITSQSNTISNNNIGAITIQGTGTTVGFWGIFVITATNQTTTVTNNTIGGAVAGGAITDTLVGPYQMTGIIIARPSVTVTRNTIRNMSGKSTHLFVSTGIRVEQSTGANIISQNTVHSLSNTSGAAGTSIYGIDCLLPATANLIERNLVHSLSMTGTNTASQLWGIVMENAGSATYQNNMVRLGLDAAGNSITTGFSIIGIRDRAGATSKYYYNSVYVGGSGVLAGGSNSFAFLSDVVMSARDFRDNIFWNARSNASGTAKHYAISVGGTGPNPPGLTSNFNDLLATGTGGFTGLFNAADQLTLLDWQTATGQDANSISADPQFINPTGTATTVDLHVSPSSPVNGRATPIAGITNDFDNNPRDPSTPDIGADEIAGTATPTPTPTPSATPTATATATPAPSPTPPTPTPTPPSTPTPTPTPTPTATPTPTPTPSATPTGTPTPITISGTVVYCSNPVPGPVPNVTMTLTGTTSSSTLTDASGNYSFAGLPSGGNYTVTPTKAARVPGSPNINTVDVIATQRHFLGLGTPLSGCRLTAADVNGDTSVNTVDVIAIQRFFLGLSTGIANTGKYKFTPVSRTYTGVTSNQTGQNYDTLVFGDTASSFVELPDGLSQDAPDEGANEIPATVALPNSAVDKFVTDFPVPVTTSVINPGDQLVGFQGDFTFDERVVTFQSPPVQKAGITGGDWNVSGNVLPGAGPIRTLRISAFSNDFTPLDGVGTLFELRMTKLGRGIQGTQLIWAAPPDNFIFIDADLETHKPGGAAPGSVTPSGK